MTLIDNLTKRQRNVYNFIKLKIQSRGYGPTVREIGERFEISSPNGVMCHLRALEKKGMIRREPNMSRAISLAPAGLEQPGLPLVGVVAAGIMHEAIEQSERVDFGSAFSPRNHFVLRVRGESMIDAQIADRDFVIVRKQKSAEKGQMVVAQTEDGDATLKYWYPERNRIRLQPANSSMAPIYVSDARILGVVVGVVRKLS